MQAKQLIIVFSKSPEAGKVKTRLIPYLGEQGALELYQLMLLSVLDACHAVRQRDVQLWIKGELTNAYITRLAEPFRFSLHEQQGVDLGESMALAFSENLLAYKSILLIGGDCVSLDGVYLQNAFDAVSQHDVVIAPSEDGGFVLFGLCTAKFVENNCKKLFADVHWGSKNVFEQMLANIHEQALSYQLLAQRWDVDEIADLNRIDRDSRFSAFFAEKEK